MALCTNGTWSLFEQAGFSYVRGLTPLLSAW